MLVENVGAIGAALHLAGIQLPSHFNVDEGFVENAKSALKGELLHLDDEAHRVLAIVKAAAQLEIAKFIAKAAADIAPVVEATKEAEPKLVEDAKDVGADLAEDVFEQVNEVAKADPKKVN